MNRGANGGANGEAPGAGGEGRLRRHLDRRDLFAALLLLGLTIVLTWPAIVAGSLGPKAYDHRLFHLPLVREWAALWPIVDLRDYNSATGPLYHWLMAGIAQLVGVGSGDETSVPLQCASSLFAATLAMSVYGIARRRIDWLESLTCGCAVLASPYVLGNAIWMMTDNLALTFVTLAIGSTAFGSTRPGSRGVQGVSSALAVATRQINLWLLAPIAASWWLGGRRGTVATILAMALPVAVLAGFVLLWHGLVPPRFRSLHASGLNPAAIGFTLTLVAAYGACLLPATQEGVRRLVARPWTVVAIAVAGAALAALGPSFASEAAGRNGGWLWSLVDAAPVIAGRSVVILFGGACGMLVLAALFAEIEPHGGKHAALVLLASLAGFVAAHVANAQIFQRYYDPMVLVILALLSVILPRRREAAWGLGLLTCQQVLFAAATLYWPIMKGG
jgi:hypothetical protein